MRARFGVRRWICRYLGHHWEVGWGLQMGRYQWHLRCAWCGYWKCLPAKRYHPRYGGRSR